MADGGGLSAEQLAASAGVDADAIERYTRAGVLEPTGGTYRERDLARIRLARSCEAGGIPMDGIAKAIEAGQLSFGFLDLPQYGWAPLSARTYEEVATELGLTVEFVARIHEALGLERPDGGDRIREDDHELLRALALAAAATGGADDSVVRIARVYGESLRRLAEAEKSWYRERIEIPFLRSGMTRVQMLHAASEFGATYMDVMDRALLHMYHRQQEHAWLDNLVQDIEETLEEMDLYERLARPPAMCFLDLAGYTRLTEEHGDAAAADLAGELARMVQGTSQAHGGRPVKWLGDGVMFHFRDPKGAVLSALEMVERTPEAGLPPAHVGVAAGPVVEQDGDYYGRTVNLAARISSRAAPSEVLVSAAVVEGTNADGLRFEGAGVAELKGFATAVELYRAERT